MKLKRLSFLCLVLALSFGLGLHLLQKSGDLDLSDVRDFHRETARIREGFGPRLRSRDRAALAGMLEDLERRQQIALRMRADEEGLAYEGDTADGRGFRLQGFEDGEPVFVYTANMIQGAESAAIAPWVRWNADFDPAVGSGIDGEGLVANVLELGTIYPQHQEFSDETGNSRILVMESEPVGSSGSREHATQVSSILGAWGKDANAIGIAPRVSFRTFGSGAAETVVYAAGKAHPAHAGASVVTNRSIGGSPSTMYHFASRDIDRALFDTPYHLLVNSAGNNGSGFQTLGGGAVNAKNTLAIGETRALYRDEDGNYESGGGIVGASSRGPTADGRIKPDLVTRADGLRAARSGSSNYRNSSGTSFSSPLAAGTVVLLADHFQRRFPERFPRSATIRALLINGADDLGNPGPDYTYGYGAINVLASSRLIRDYADDPQSRLLVEDALAEGGVWMRNYTVAESGRVRVALSWLDPAFPSQTFNQALVNNLHVKVIGPDGTEVFPYVMPYALDDTASFSAHAVREENPVDPNLLVEIHDAAPGTYTVKVYHGGELLEGIPQEFSLAVSGMAASGLAEPEIFLDAPLVLTERRDQMVRVPVAEMLVGAVVRLERAGSASMEVAAVGREEGRMTFYVNPGEMEPGYWDLRLLNPDGSEALASGAVLVNAASAYQLFWDMQTDPGFTLESDGDVSWSFGEPGGIQNDPVFGPFGPQILGTNPGAHYSGDFDVSAISPVLDFSEASDLLVNVHHWLNKDGSVEADFAVQVNGGTWESLWSTSFLSRWNRWQILNSGNPWSEGPIALPGSVNGQSEVRFRFRLRRATSSTTQDIGWNLGGFEIVQETVQVLYPPVFTSDPVTEAAAGQFYSHTLTAGDADTALHELSWHLEAGPAWLTLLDNGDGSALLSGTAEAGTHEVEIRVSDGDYDAWQVFTLEVDSSLVFVGVPEFSGDPGASTATVHTQSTGASAVLTATTLPGWLSFEDHGDGSGMLTQQAFEGDYGAHDVVIEADNGEESETLSFVAYRQMQDRVLTLHPHAGTEWVLLVANPDLDAMVVNALVSNLEAARGFYAQSTGREPGLFFQYNGLPTIAEVPNGSTCGAGCGYLGFTGIELTQTVFTDLYEGVRDRNEYDQAVFYEMGRNFWFYDDELAYPDSGDDFWVIPTGYAVFMRFMSMEAAGVAGGPFNGDDFQDFEAEVRGLLGTYLADESKDWGNTLRSGQGVANGMGLGGTDLFASFLLRLTDVYGASIPNTIWQEAGVLNAATNTQGAVDNFIRAASSAAGENLAPLFAYWRWPVPTALESELADAYPGSAPGDLGFSVSEVMVNGDAGTVALSVVREGGSAGEVSVAFTSVDGTAAAGTYYQPVSGTLTWADGDMDAKSVFLDILDFAAPEDLTVDLSISLGSPTDGAGLGGNANLTVSIFYEGEVIPIVPEIALIRPMVETVRIPEGVGLVLETEVSEIGGESGAMALAWTVQRGDGAVTWDHTDQAETVAWFGAQGEYVLRLTADNGENHDVLDIAVRVVDPDLIAGGDNGVGDGEAVVSDAEAHAFPEGWDSITFGSPAESGEEIWEDDGLEIAGSTGDFWIGDDSGHFVYTTVSGDVDLRAKLSSFMARDGGSVHQWAKAGVMIRNNLADQSFYGLMKVQGSSGRRQVRNSFSSNPETANGNSLGDYPWFRITRTGDELLFYQSKDGGNWEEIGSAQTLVLGEEVFVGLAVSSHPNSGGGDNTAVALFEHLELNGALVEAIAGGSPRNIGPLVDAGEAQWGGENTETTLSGGVEDDGLPAVPGEVTTGWHQLSGPEMVSLSDPFRLSTTFTPEIPGEYVFRLVAFDGEVATASDVRITVEAGEPDPYHVWLAENGVEEGEVDVDGRTMDTQTLFVMGASLNLQSGEWEGVLRGTLTTDAGGGSPTSLSFEARPGRTYRLQFLDNLTDPDAEWTDVDDAIIADEGPQTFPLTLPETGHRFYRILVSKSEG
ncbi:MAG: S8 family serine peptidase [Kiritimatiellae bacterium]|nr:S8 family serine peptidase [Kiritimatiellia bacterium]